MFCMDKRTLSELVYAVGYILFVCTTVSGDGVVSVRLECYTNDNGLGSNGNCCDGKWGMCRSDCDHYFTVCLDKEGVDLNTNSCDYGRVVTNAIKNRNTNVFGNTIGRHGTRNPIEFYINGNINILTNLKIRVMDADSGFAGSDDHVDDLRADVYVHKGHFPEATLPVTLHSRTTLTTKIVIRCAPHWYDQDCSVYCQPSANDNFYCDQWTGEKICHPEWTGEDCLTPEFY